MAFIVFTMARVVAPNWPAFLVFRLICGFMASSGIKTVGGLFADVFNNPIAQGRAIAAFMAVGRAHPLLQSFCLTMLMINNRT